MACRHREGEPDLLNSSAFGGFWGFPFGGVRVGTCKGDLEQRASGAGWGRGLCHTCVGNHMHGAEPQGTDNAWLQHKPHFPFFYLIFYYRRKLHLEGIIRAQLQAGFAACSRRAAGMREAGIRGKAPPGLRGPRSNPLHANRQSHPRGPGNQRRVLETLLGERLHHKFEMRGSPGEAINTLACTSTCQASHLFAL